MDRRQQAPPLQPITITAQNGASICAPLLNNVNIGGGFHFSFQSGLRSAGASDERAEPLAAGPNGTAEERHFVDVHRVALIERVRNVDAVLDQLLDQGVVTQRVYDEIMAESTSQKKMGKILSGPIHAGGEKAKDVLYQILESQELYLMDDLK